MHASNSCNGDMFGIENLNKLVAVRKDLKFRMVHRCWKDMAGGNVTGFKCKLELQSLHSAPCKQPATLQLGLLLIGMLRKILTLSASMQRCTSVPALTGAVRPLWSVKLFSFNLFAASVRSDAQAWRNHEREKLVLAPCPTSVTETLILCWGALHHAHPCATTPTLCCARAF